MRSLDEAIAQADVLYMTRIQKERFATQEEYDQVSGVYRLDTTLMAKVSASHECIYLYRFTCHIYVQMFIILVLILTSITTLV